MPDYLLEVKNLKIHFFTRKGTVYAVDDISFTLQEGETLGLVGESGCGKTTTVMGLMNMVSPPGRIVSGAGGAGSPPRPYLVALVPARSHPGAPRGEEDEDRRRPLLPVGGPPEPPHRWPLNPQ